MQQFLPEDFGREHRQLLNQEAENARLVNLVRANKRENQHQVSSVLLSVVRKVLVKLNEWRRRRSQVTVQSKPVTAGR